MSISYAIVVHNNPEQLKRLVEKLNAPWALFIVHVDAKIDIEPFRQAVGHRENVLFVEHRINVVWGAYTILRATIACLEKALEVAPDSYILNLSGQCYPVKSNQYIFDFVQRNQDKVFISYTKLPSYRWSNNGGLGRIYDYHYCWAVRNSAHITPLKFNLENFKQIGKIILKKPVLLPAVLSDFFHKRRPPLTATDFYMGETWFAMPAPVARNLVTSLQCDPCIEYYFTKCLSPEEFLPQTILLHEKKLSGQIVNNCLRYIDWEGKLPHSGSLPVTFTTTYWDDIQMAIKDTQVLFARKFDQDIDADILNQIDQCTN